MTEETRRNENWRTTVEEGTQGMLGILGPFFTFALAEVQLQDVLEQRVCAEGEVKLGAHLRLQGPFDPLVLGRCYALDQSI